MPPGLLQIHYEDYIKAHWGFKTLVANLENIPRVKLE
jgi:hypothetical protein